MLRGSAGCEVRPKHQPWFRLMFLETRRCFYCGVRIARKKVTADHYFPVAAGGTDEPSNIRVCCERCNRAKADKLPHEFNPRATQ